jgi:hypothetical protein
MLAFFAPFFRESREYWRVMEKKYRRASTYPWLLVTPDPPEPE